MFAKMEGLHFLNFQRGGVEGVDFFMGEGWGGGGGGGFLAGGGGGGGGEGVLRIFWK